MFLVTMAAALATVQPPAQIVQDVSRQLGDGAEHVEIPAGMFRPVDINQDGLTDWHINYEVAGTTMWCGTGGCRHQLYVSRPDGGYEIAFNEVVRDFAVRNHHVMMDVYGSYCGTAGAVECRRAFAWSGTEGRLVPIRARGQDSRLFGPLFQPVTNLPERLPDAVWDVVVERKADCEAQGGILDEAHSAYVLSPDLDGDQRQDWIIGSPYSACLRPVPSAGDDARGEEEELPNPPLVVVSGASSGRGVIFQAATASYVVDISLPQASLMLVPDEETRMQDCPGRPTRCAGTRFQFDAEKSWLEPF